MVWHPKNTSSGSHHDGLDWSVENNIETVAANSCFQICMIKDRWIDTIIDLGVLLERLFTVDYVCRNKSYKEWISNYNLP